MKKIHIILFLFLAFVCNAQNGISYQAVIMNPKGEELPGADNARSPLVNQSICLRFSIKSGTMIDYQEDIITQTDEFGMVNVIIGTGIRTGGTAANFAAIIWDGSPKNLLVEFDSTASCSNFIQVSNQPFTAVPYAFYAANSGSPVSPSLTENYIYVGNLLNKPVEVPVNGDAGIDSTGYLTITTAAVTTGKIANNAVETLKIKDANVTYAKIQNVSGTNKVLGRVSTGSGLVEEISTTGSGDVVRSTSPTLVSPALGAATGISLSVTGQLTSTVAIGTPPLVVTSTTPVANLNIGGNAATVTTNADLTGAITSAGNATFLGSFTSANLATALSDETGTGSVVLSASPTFTGTPSAPTAAASTSTTQLATTEFVTTANATNANLSGMVTSVGNTTTVVTNADLTGPITSIGNATAIASQTGTGSKFVMDTAPTLVTPVLGVATATSINSTTIPTSKTLVITENKLNVMASTTSTEFAGVISDETGTGSVVLSASPTFTGTPSAPTAAASTSTTQLATTEFVTTANATNANLSGMVTSVGNTTTVVTNADLTGMVTSIGNATTVVTNADLTGAITSIGNATSITSNAVTEAKLDTDAVTSAKIKDGAIVEADLDNNAVTTDKIKNNAITTNKIADGAVTTPKIKGFFTGKYQISVVNNAGSININIGSDLNITGGVTENSTIIFQSNGSEIYVKYARPIGLNPDSTFNQINVGFQVESSLNYTGTLKFSYIIILNN